MSSVTVTNVQRWSRLSDPSARTRVLVAAIAGASGAVAVAFLGPWWLVPLSGWILASLVFVGWIWRSVATLDPSATATHARREDPGRALADSLLLGAAAVSLLAVGLVLLRAGSMSGVAKLLLVAASAFSVLLAWAVVHTVFSLRYARIYYRGHPGGVDFNEEQQPCYVDFAYLALTIGMTFQVSDTDITSSVVRGTALRHALLSYLFGALFIAITVNLIAGMSK